MKKSTLLSLATAGAVIATSAGTFALWDTIEATNTSEVLTLESRVTISTTAATFSLEGERTLNVDPVYTGDVTFTVSDYTEADKKLANNIELSDIKVVASDYDPKAPDGSKDYTNLFTVEVSEKDGATIDADSNKKYVDTSVSDNNTYTVKLTTNAETEEEAAKLNGIEVKVLVTGTLTGGANTGS